MLVKIGTLLGSNAATGEGSNPSNTPQIELTSDDGTVYLMSDDGLTYLTSDSP